VDADAVQIMTVHQAKGLEFPVVILWDSCAGWRGRADSGPWRVARDGKGWELALDRLTWKEPPTLDLMASERTYREAERKRVVYVAATRARDLLVLPQAEGFTGEKSITARLLEGEAAAMVLPQQAYKEGKGAAWARGLKEPSPRQLVADEQFEAELAARWDVAAVAASRPRHVPIGVASAAKAQLAFVAPPGDDAVADAAEPPPVPRKPRKGRYGPAFGELVHGAIGQAVAGSDIGAAVRRMATTLQYGDHLDEAAADVARAVDALRAEQLLAGSGTLRLEYPIVGSAEGVMLVGYIDLVHATDTHLTVVDFKTDAPVAGTVESTHPEYVAQVRSYAELLKKAGVVGMRQLRCGLLFTADGGVRWSA
jgi:ATP-dependent helicase/nuclease subunit A